MMRLEQREIKVTKKDVAFFRRAQQRDLRRGLEYGVHVHFHIRPAANINENRVMLYGLQGLTYKFDKDAGAKLKEKICFL